MKFIRNNKTVISLEITYCCDDERGPNMDIILNSLGCTMISRFVLMNDITYSNQYISWEMMNRPTYALEELTIGGHRGLNPHILSCVIRNLPNLKYLKISSTILTMIIALISISYTTFNI